MNVSAFYGHTVNSRSLGKVVEECCIEFCRLSGRRVSVVFQTKEVQKEFGDFAFVESGKSTRVDVKAEQLVTENFPIELWQCVDKKSPGWIWDLNQCDEIWYSQWRPDSRTSANCIKAYRMSVPKLKGIACRAKKLFGSRFTEKGYGKTEFVLAPLDWLCSNGVALPFTELLNYLQSA